MAQVKRHGVNKYQISVYLGRDENGKRIFHYETFHGSKTQAQYRAAELEVEMKRRIGPRNAAMMVDEYLCFWLKRIQDSVDEGTYRTYTFHTKRLNPLVKSLSMYGVTALDLQDRLSGLSGLGLKPKTIKGIYGTLKTAMRQAVAWGILPTDPTVGLRAPRVPKAEKRVLDARELAILLETAKNYKHHIIVRIIAITGMRLGEALALKWKDVDFESGTIVVQRAVNTRKRELKPDPKTSSSRRTIPLDEETLIFLKDLKDQIQETNFKEIRDALVFHSDYNVNIPVRDNSVRRTLRIIRAAGLPDITIHDLRHTAGSLLVAAGYPLPMVSSFLGHSSPATTTAVYSHAIGRGINVTDALRGCQADCRADN